MTKRSVTKILNLKGQSTLEFLILVPVLAYAILVSYQVFSSVCTSLVNQGAVHFEAFRLIDNNRGRARRLNELNLPKPIFPERETYSKTYRATNKGGNTPDIKGSSSYPYLAVKVEEPRGSNADPKREIRTIGSKMITIRTHFGVCEVDRGICQ